MTNTPKSTRFPAYALRRTQDINTADIYGLERIYDVNVTGSVQTPQTEPPWDGYIYGVRNGVWTRDIVQVEAPGDGDAYARVPHGWVSVTYWINNITMDAGTY